MIVLLFNMYSCMIIMYTFNPFSILSSIHHHLPLPPPPGVVYNYTALDTSDLHKVHPRDDHYGRGDIYIPTSHTNGRGSECVPLPQTPASIGKKVSHVSILYYDLFHMQCLKVKMA